MKRLTFTFTTFFALFFASQIKSQTVFVAQNATGSGASWADATGNLRVALDNATAGTKIWVKEGTYTPTTCTNCAFNDRNQQFQVKSGTKLYGGFGGFETNLNQRNIQAHPTLLSGDINQDGLLTGNSFTVVFTQNVNSQTVVDGFTITGGNADQGGAGLGTPQSGGAGWFNLGSTTGGNSSPTISNCTFSNNFAIGYGAGMFNDGSFNGNCSPTLTNCIFIKNIAHDDGGAMYNTGSFNGNSSPVLQNCQFIENKSEAADGGAMFNMGQAGNSSPMLTNCHFVRDTAFKEGGAVVNLGRGGVSSPKFSNCNFEGNVADFGAGVYCDAAYDGFSGAEFHNCNFSENHSYFDGAALYNSGYLGECNPSILGCVFENNRSTFAGGAIFNNGDEGICDPVIRNCRFISNQAETYGGAIYNLGKGEISTQTPGDASPEITNCLFQNNMALSAGAIYNLGAQIGNASAMITNCTFYGNHANVGGAVYCNAGEGGTGTSSPTIRNCIFWANTAPLGKVFRVIYGTPTISHSITDVANCAALYSGIDAAGSVTCGDGVLFNQDPMFISPASGNFHLSSGSPAIDDGNNSAIVETGVGIDLDSLPRIHNATVDMGVYEFGSSMGSSPTITQSPQSQTVCEGADAIFSVSVNGAQPLDFQWVKDGVAIAGASQNVLNISNAAQSDVGSYTCTVTNNAGSSTSQPAVLNVNAPALVAVEIMASQTEVCQGETITLSATPTNGGNQPIFQWLLNGNAFGTSVQSFPINQLEDGDSFQCQLTSSANCVANPVVTSNSLTINVETLLVASLSIAVDAVPVCEGTPATLTATPNNGGNFPSYLWTLDGMVVGANAPTLLVPDPTEGAIVLCTMTSSKPCVTENPVESNMVELELAENLAATVVIEPSFDSTICAGETVWFSASVTNGGNTPGYEWLVNGQAAGDDSETFTTDQLNDGDVVVCYLTSSENCVAANPVLSNTVVASVDVCGGATVVSGGKIGMSVLPNPSSGKILLNISNPNGNFVLRIVNTQGQLAFGSLENHTNFPFERELDLSALPKGVYFLQIISGTQSGVQKLVLH